MQTRDFSLPHEYEKFKKLYFYILYLDIDAPRFSELEMRENNCIRITNIDSDA